MFLFRVLGVLPISFNPGEEILGKEFIMERKFNVKNTIELEKNVNEFLLAEVVRIHNGIFHSDDVMIVAILNILGYHPRVIRSREEIPADLTFDVGGLYSPNDGLFDHHQQGEKPCWILEGHEIPMSSFGQLIWSIRFYAADDYPYGWGKLLEWSITNVCAPDNGVQMFDGEGVDTFASVISGFNAEDAFGEEQEVAFQEAVAFATGFLKRKLSFWERQGRFATSVLSAAKEADNGVMFLEEGGPWRETVTAHSEDFEGISLIVFPSGLEWRVQTLPDPQDSSPFSMKAPSPKGWRGLRGNDLEVVSGVSGAGFAHPGGFIAGANTKESALALAKAWLGA